jgi:2,4-dienoyl-CoA reductase-like NADH-dependent reductase (Old Yellow Enzyme family)
MTHLLAPYALRSVTFKNRIGISPMSQYRAKEGAANTWHLVHLGRFALGGAGLVYTEATAVQRVGRRTHGDLGLWQDDQIDGLREIAAFLEEQGAVPGIQLSHAGRKASERRPWHGETPVDAQDVRERGEAPWQAVAPSPIAYADGWPTPLELSEADIWGVIAAFGDAAGRAHQAGFKILEVYAAHGFLIHQFLSPISNHRQDAWGGSPERRLRFALEVAKAIRQQWPEDLPLAFRLSATDWVAGGLEVEDTIEIARSIKAAGVDMIDVSSGGIGGKERPKRMAISQGFQVPFAAAIRREVAIATMAVGFLWDAQACDDLVSAGDADMIALAREALDDPNWPLHAARQLDEDRDYEAWPIEAGWWLMKRDKLLRKFKLRP